MASHFSFCVPPAAHQPDIRSLDMSISQRRMHARLIRLFWLFLYILLATFPIVFLPQTLNAGGPHYVAGISYFDAGTKGIPLTWTQGSISYYTDQGDLSPLLLHAGADAFVADAFSRWTSITTAAVVMEVQRLKASATKASAPACSSSGLRSPWSV